MRAPRKSSAWSSRVRFLGSESGRSHRDWYQLTADYYTLLYKPARDRDAARFLDRLFRRTGGIRDVLDIACGPFTIGLELAKRGYHVVGRDRSEAMVRVARRNLRGLDVTAEVGRADMRSLSLRRRFDAILCLGTAFNYLIDPVDVRRALRGFRGHLRPGGLLVLDLANFDAWIDDSPMNAMVQMDWRARDGTRIAIFAFNEQREGKTIHLARFITVRQRGGAIDLRFDEAPLKVWRKEGLSRELRRAGFRSAEWWGDLKPGTRYIRRKSIRLVSVGVRT